MTSGAGLTRPGAQRTLGTDACRETVPVCTFAFKHLKVEPEVLYAMQCTCACVSWLQAFQQAPCVGPCTVLDCPWLSLPVLALVLVLLA